MWEERDLKLLVITNEVSEWDPAAQWTIDNDQRFRVFGDRYLTIQLVATDLYTDPGYFWDTVELIEAPIFVHSKLRLVDDRYLSVGSCNWNNRGYKYEGELNVAILDPGLARATRRRLLAQIAGPAWAPFLSDDMENNLAVLALAAQDNAELAEWWDETGEDLDADEAERAWAAYRTSGWAFPLTFPEDWTWDVGPDVF
jgi:phosphatidylserine/phosphatidylglycerophosphate/cardiolipin synthase-like enzyme